KSQLRMMAPLQQQLFTAVPECLLNFSFVGVNIGDIGLRVTGYPVEVAEFTVGNAYVGCINVSVNDPGNLAVWNLFLSQFVGNKHQFGKGSMLENEHTFVFCKKFEIQGTLI